MRKSDTFSIRLARASDTAAAVAVVYAVCVEYGFTWDPSEYHADLLDLKTHYLDCGHSFWVAEHVNGSVIGTIALECFDTISGAIGCCVEVDGLARVCGADCAIQRLYVHPDSRRSGVGSALLETFLQDARHRQRTHVEIWSDKRLEASHRLYRRFGAMVVGERICWTDPDQAEEWGMILKL